MAQKNAEVESTRQGIRQTASTLFMTGGVHATSLADISKAAKLSKGTLYYHYPTKEYLVLDIAEEHFGRMTDSMFAWIDYLAEGMPAQEALRSLTETLLQDPDSMRLHFALMSEALREEGALRKRVAAKQREWAVMLEVGSLRMTEPGAQRFRTYSRAYLALLDGCALHQLLTGHLDVDILLKLLTEE